MHLTANTKARQNSAGLVFVRRRLLLASAGNLQVIHDGKHSRNAVSTNAGHVFVGLVIDYAVQSDMAIDYRNPNRLRRIERVLVQRLEP